MNTPFQFILFLASGELQPDSTDHAAIPNTEKGTLQRHPVMEFETEAYIDEYVVEGENTGTFAGDTSSLTYIPEDPDTWPSFSVPTETVTRITFGRDTSLHNNRFLGVFFAGFTVLLTILTYLTFFAGQITSPELNATTFFMFFAIVGSISITYDALAGENHDVVSVSIRTNDDEQHVLFGRMENAEFVEACEQLLESELDTRSQNKELDRKLST